MLLLASQPAMRMTALGGMAMLFVACAPVRPLTRPAPPAPVVTLPQNVPEPQRIDPMADVPGDRPLPPLQGALERIDCTSGVENLHARMAVEALGGQVASFAYYSRWTPRTCALDFERDDPNTKWRLMADGATRVQTPQGIFVIRTHADSYTFEFQKIPRQKFCGMLGTIDGTMTILRNTQPPVCAATGILDANDEYLENLRRLKQSR